MDDPIRDLRCAILRSLGIDASRAKKVVITLNPEPVIRIEAEFIVHNENAKPLVVDGELVTKIEALVVQKKSE